MDLKQARVANYHTHTARCGHAAGMEEEYIRSAVGSGYRILGFSDHTPWPYESGYTHPGVRMTTEMLPGYLASLRELREKYRDRLKLYIGLECEYFPAYLPWLRETAERERLDHLILGNHFELSDETGIYYGRATEKEQVRSYVRTTVAGMETGLFCCLAHPDLVLMSYPVFDAACLEASRTLCRAAKALALPLEYNVQGLRYMDTGRAVGLGYPCRRFWEIAAEEGNTAVIGVDAHDPAALGDDGRYGRALAALEELEIPVLRTLPGLA